jgi:GNAT superfamily N-acetyltransferase
MELHIKPLKMSDITQILQIQSQCYSRVFLEGISSFQSKLQFFPEGCVGIVHNNTSVTLAGYLISFPWFSHRPFHLNSSVVSEEPQDYTCYYIHDVAVHPDVRGLGVGRQLVSHAEQIAFTHGWDNIYLVSVQNSQNFWEKQGFCIEETVNYGKEQPESDTSGGFLMVKSIYRSD